MKLSRNVKTLIAVAAICGLVVSAPGVWRTDDSPDAAGGSAGGAATAASAAGTLAAADAADAAEIPADAYAPIDLTAVAASTLAAENGRFQLYIDERSGQLRVRDKTTGREWSGAPEADDSMPPNNRKVVNNPVNFRYTTGKEITLSYPEKEKAGLHVELIDNGARLHYNIDALGLQFAVEYTLTEQGFDAAVPFGYIRELGASRITGIELLPFFDAATPQHTGALFVPDGSGALLRFKQDAPSGFEFYSEMIYGGDHAFQTNVYERVGFVRVETVSKTPREQIALPVFGLYKENRAFLGIVAQGAYDAKINAYPSGIRNIPMYRISAEFIYRNSDIIYVGTSGEIPMTERQLIAGDRKLRYVLLQGDKADYVGMAESYRDYLIAEQGLGQTVLDGLPLQLRLFGGVQREDAIGSTFVAMTGFEQAGDIVDALRRQGVERIEVTYDGWSKDGVRGDQPQHFPAARGLGGNKGLERLAERLRAAGAELYLSANYVKPYSGSDEVSPGRDAIRGLNREVMPLYKPHVTTRQHSSQLFYLLKPQRVFDRYIAKEADTYADLHVDGVHLAHMGELIYSDHDKLPAQRRAETAGLWQQTLELMRGKTGRAAVNYGNAYTLGSVDRIDDMPLGASQFVYLDDEVPFYQIAVRGYVPYTAKPFNLTDDPRVYRLKLLEYGALPSYLMTYEDSSLLKRTRINELFSTAYTYWAEQAVEQFKAYGDVAGPLLNQRIADHQVLQPGVRRTTYEDGTEITVNYNQQPVTVGGARIEGFGHAVAKGGGGA